MIYDRRYRVVFHHHHRVSGLTLYQAMKTLSLSAFKPQVSRDIAHVQRMETPGTHARPVAFFCYDRETIRPMSGASQTEWAEALDFPQTLNQPTRGNP